MRRDRIYIGLATMLHLLTLAIIALAPFRVNHDVSMYLTIGDKILMGQLPYVDYFEINFPMIHYLSAIPVWVSGWLPLNRLPLLLLLMWGLVAVAAVITGHLSAHLFPDRSTLARYSIPLALVAHSLIAIFWNEYAQREHIFIVCFIVAFLLRHLRVVGAIPADWHPAPLVAIGMLGAIGVATKPHFALIVIVTEAYNLLRYRNWQALRTPEVAGFMTIALLHILYFALQPSVLRGLITVLTDVRTGYQAYGYAPSGDFFQIRLEVLIVLILCATFFLRPTSDTHRSLIALL